MAFESSLQTRLNNLEIRDRPIDAMYRATYPLFLDYFQQRIAAPNLTENDAKIAVTLVYAWMTPAKLNTEHWSNFNIAKDALRELTAGMVLNPDQLKQIKSFVGGSLIATSKFLHLLDPNRFAIWDRRVAYAGYRYRYHSQYNRNDAYLTYLDDLKELALPPHVDRLVSNALNDASEVRKKEFALFHLGIQETAT